MKADEKEKNKLHLQNSIIAPLLDVKRCKGALTRPFTPLFISELNVYLYGFTEQYIHSRKRQHHVVPLQVKRAVENHKYPPKHFLA